MPAAQRRSTRAAVEPADTAEFMPDRQQNGDDDEAEEDPAGQDLERIRRLEERPEEREEPPQQVRAEPVQQPAGGRGAFPGAARVHLPDPSEAPARAGPGVIPG